MADSDRNIRFVPTISPEEAEKGFKRLAKSAQDTFNKLSLENPDQQLKKLQANLAKTVANGEKLSNSLEKAKNVKIPTDEYKQLQIDLKTAEREYTKLLNKQEQFIAKGKEKTGAFEDLQHQTEAVAREITNIEGLMEELQNKDLAFTVDESKIQAATAALESNNNQIRLQEEALANLQQKQSEMSQQRASQLSQEVDAQAQQIAKMLEIKLNAGEINSEIGETIERLQEIRSELAELQARQAELEAAGAGLGYEEYDRNLHVIRELTDEQSRLNEEVAQYRTEQEEGGQATLSIWERVGELFKQIGHDILHPIEYMRELSSNTEEAGQSAKRSNFSFSNLSATIGKLAGSFITSVSGINRFTSALKNVVTKSNSASFSFKKLFTTLLRYGIGIRSIYALFNKLRRAITENIQYYALMNNGMNQTNHAISAMQSSLNALKGALAGAFVPILTVVSPILSKLMDQLAGVITSIGMFIAKLTGAKSYMKAVKKETNYAAGTSAGKAGQKAQDKYEESVKKAQEKYNKAVEKAQSQYDTKLAKTQEKNAKAEAKATEKQAKAADKLAKAQKKANDELSTLDNLNVINTQDMEELEDIQATLYDEPVLELPDLEDYMKDLADAAGDAASDAPFDLIEVPLDDIKWNWDDLKAKAEELGKGISEKLNNFFAKEDFAKKLGHDIAEALNTALHFAYGFIHNFDWKQMGHWLGTLVQEGLETFEWDLLGKTIGETLNGIADTIIGFFERYQVGTIGSSIATMLNNAIETVDPEKLGEAVADILKWPFVELKTFFTETNWKEAGKKFGEFFHKVVTSDELDGKTLGEDIGEFLKAAIDAAMQFLIGVDKSQFISDVGKLFYDIFSNSGIVGQILLAVASWNILTKIFGVIMGTAGTIAGAFGTLTGALGKFAGASKGAAAAGEAAEGAATTAAGGASAAATAATAALGVFDAAIVAYDVGKLVQIHNDWEKTNDEHEKATEDYCNSITKLYHTAGQKAVNDYAGEEVNMEELYKKWERATGDNKVELEKTLTELNKVYDDAGNNAVSTVAGHNTTLKEEIDKTQKEYEEMPHNMWEGFSAGWDDYFGQNGKGLGQLVSDAFTEMVTTIKDLLKIGSPSKVMEEIGDDTVKGLENGLTFDNLLSTVDTRINTLISKFQTNFTGNKLLSAGTLLITGLKSGIAKEFSTTLSTVQTNINTLINRFKTNLSGNKLTSVGTNLINGLKSGLISGLNSAISTVTSMCNRITSAARNAFQIHSPSKVFEGIGENLILGLQGGVEDNTDDVYKAFDELVPSDDMLKSFYNLFISMMSKLTTNVSEMFDDMSEHITDSIDGLDSLSKFKGLSGNIGLSNIAIPDIVQGYKLPSNLALTSNGGDLSSQLPDMLKKALIEAISEGYNFDSSNGSIIINVDGKSLFEIVRTRNSQYKKQHGTSAFT